DRRRVLENNPVIRSAHALCIALGTSAAAIFTSENTEDIAHAASNTMIIGLYVASSGSDSNSGTDASPFRTIFVSSSVERPGTIIHVAAGAYEGGCQTTVSGTAPAPIHYGSDTRWGAVIVPPANSTSDTAWDNRGAYVVIDGFQIDGTHQ